MEYKKINLATWERRSHYGFFKQFELPFFNITTPIEVTKLLQWTKEKNLSFFLSCIYFVTKTANQIPAFRYRIKGADVVEYETIHAGCTILYEDNTFGFCYFDYDDNIIDFCRAGQQKIAQQKAKKDLAPGFRDDLLHLSVIPWVSFTNFQHARKLGIEDSIPKIVWGKTLQEGNIWKMPVSVEVHHALADGYHVGKYFEQLQKNFNQTHF